MNGLRQKLVKPSVPASTNALRSMDGTYTTISSDVELLAS